MRQPYPALNCTDNGCLSVPYPRLDSSKFLRLFGLQGLPPLMFRLPNNPLSKALLFFAISDRMRVIIYQAVS